ncbi:MAG: DnaJ domain-containing protein [Microscillaceae bacterium]|nr:DnaJ domain-containing protein [Microscillaceae bacterium]
MPTYYEILELDRNADKQAIKAAYKKLAMKYHPDHNPGSTTAEERFKQINEAYKVLSDATKKQNYDLGLELLKISPYHYQQYQNNTYSTNPPKTNTHYEPYVNTYDPANYVSNSLKFKIKIFAGIFLLCTTVLGLFFYRYITQLTANNHYQEALDFFEKEKYRASLVKIGYVFEYQPNHLEAHILRAKINSEKYQNYVMALGDYEFVIQKMKTPPAEIHYKIGKCYFHLYDFDKAIIEFEKAINLPEPKGEYYYYLGLSKIKSEKKYADICDNLKAAQQFGYLDFDDESLPDCP